MIVAVVVAIAVVAVSVMVAWLLRPTKFSRMVEKIPGPPTLPLLGNAHMLSTNASEFFNQLEEYCRTYYKEGIFKILLGVRPMIILCKAETAEVLMNSTKHITKSEDYKFLHPWLGTGLLTSTGEKWKVRRRLITPTFHFRILKDFQHIFNHQCKIMVDILSKKVGQEEFDIFPYITHCALDIICDTAMGINVNAQNISDSEYVTAIYKISELVHRRQKAPWLWPDIIYNLLPMGKQHQHCLRVLHGFTQKIIKERTVEMREKFAEEKVQTLEEVDSEALLMGQRKRLAFLDMLIYASLGEAKLSQEDIREEVDTFMFEGHDTTAAAANWAVHLIGANPNVQEKLHDEMDAIFGDDDRAASMEDLKDMKYLECVIKETLRLFPSVPMFGRTFSEDCVIGGYDVPRGSTGVIITGMLQRDERYFPEPEKFDPDRFTRENSAGRHPYAFIPFSAGMRNCIGQKFAMNEEKVILSSILRNFHIESTQKREELNPMGEIITRPEKGIWIKLTKRPKN